MSNKHFEYWMYVHYRWYSKTNNIVFTVLLIATFIAVGAQLAGKGDMLMYTGISWGISFIWIVITRRYFIHRYNKEFS